MSLQPSAHSSNPHNDLDMVLPFQRATPQPGLMYKLLRDDFLNLPRSPHPSPDGHTSTPNDPDFGLPDPPLPPFIPPQLPKSRISRPSSPPPVAALARALVARCRLACTAAIRKRRACPRRALAEQQLHTIAEVALADLSNFAPPDNHTSPTCPSL